MHSKAFYGILIFLFLGISAWGGTFTDRDGGKHQWYVNDTHTLVWDGNSYIPFGVEFTPKYLTDAQTEENLAADEAEIGALKLAGISDVIIKPEKALNSIPPSAFQRIIDLLETNGMHYGIELNDSPYSSLVGWVIAPTKYREDGIQARGEVIKSIPDTQMAFYVLCNAITGEVNRQGQATVAVDEVRISVEEMPAVTQVLLIYPLRKIRQSSPEWGLPDLWASYDKHRDHLVAYLSQLKFGPGLRFFVDPFTERLAPVGDTESMFPASPSFRIEYSSWLSRKYNNTQTLSTQWALTDYVIKTYTEAARLIPLWRQGRGVGEVYDPSTNKRYKVDPTRSTIWQDFLEFRETSVRGYMNSVADALKRLVADVPVVFTGNALQPMFQNSDPAGYDGLVVPKPFDNRTTNQRAAEVLSLAENSMRNIWILSRISPAAPGETVYQKKEELFAELNTLRSLGSKGFFLSQIPAEAKIGSADLLFWLAEYGNLSISDKQFASYRPRVAFYPKDYGGIGIKRFNSGVWWIPSLAAGHKLNLGEAYGGYVLAGVSGMGLYIWSTKGSRTITIATPQPITLTTLIGEKTTLNPSKGRVAILLSEEPVIVDGIPPEQFLPLEVVVGALQELEKLIEKARTSVPDIEAYVRLAAQAKKQIEKNEFLMSYDFIMGAIQELEHRVRAMETAPPGMTGGM
ncbi:MAG: hypothetical protein QHH26_11415 [Armatimonadota bacterium]|nr:hypothetical protein [Armatimonadota bacterium]